MKEVKELMSEKDQEIRPRRAQSQANDTHQLNRALLFCDLHEIERLVSKPKLARTIHVWAEALRRKVLNLQQLDQTATIDARIEQIERIIKEST